MKKIPLCISTLIVWKPVVLRDMTLVIANADASQQLSILFHGQIVLSYCPKQDMEGKAGLDALFLFATEGILVMDQAGCIIRINPSAERLFGYAPDELLGQKIEVLVPQRFAGSHQVHRDKYNAKPHARSMGLGMDLFGLRKNGGEFPVEISLSPYATPEGRYVIAFIIDITIRRQAEEKLRNYSVELENQVRNRTLILEEAISELENTKQELKDALDKERELNELKSRFVSMASHEFRTPLATIQSSLSLVKKYSELNDAEKQDKHIGRIKNSINTLTDILNDFLSVSKLEEGKVENQPVPFGLEAFMADIFHDMRGIAAEKQQLRYSHTGGDEVMLDKKLFRHIVVNLISNAIKFSPPDGVIEVTSERTADNLSVVVRDNGIGISREDQKHLFERFFRARNATHIQGTGLGLNIVARYTELMEGTIQLKSKEKSGTTITLTFPQSH